MANPIRYFLDNFGKVPEQKPPIIPGPWRIPFFIGLSVASFLVLLAFVYWIVIPAVRTQSMPAPARAPYSVN